MVVDLILLGAAYHQDPGYNNFNPGLGIQVQIAEQSGLGKNEHVQFYVGGATYLDSYENQAYVSGLGARASFGNRRGLHGGPDIMIGYADTTAYRGVAMLPTAFVAYDRVAVHAAVMSSNGDTIGFFLRYTVEIP